MGTALALLAVGLSACVNTHLPQDTLNPAGPTARTEDNLLWPVFWIAVGVFVLVEGLLVVALFKFRHRPGRGIPTQIHGNFRMEMAWTIAPALLLAGVAVPTVATIFRLSERPSGQYVQVAVTGHQWWWEVKYPDLKVVTANEIHIPVGQPVYVSITSIDVIHSFWVPRLAGKQDLEPGRTNHLTIEADLPGVYLGQCAEYCGTSHANMRFRVMADSPADFQSWVKAQAGPAPPSTDPLAQQGQQVFEQGRFAGGLQCTACHTDKPNVGGTVGPNLSHFGDRTTFAGSIVRNTEGELRRWLTDPSAVKPGADMPNLHLAPDQIDALIAYLEGLK
jgi:cytochrome c oxidase subunit II